MALTPQVARPAVCPAGPVSGGGARGEIILIHRNPVISSPARALAPQPSGLSGGRLLLARSPEKSAAARRARAPRRAHPWYVARPLPSPVRADRGRSPRLSVGLALEGIPLQRGNAPSSAQTHCRPRSVLQRAVESLLPIRRIGASGYEGRMRIAWPCPAVGEPCGPGGPLGLQLACHGRLQEFLAQTAELEDCRSGVASRPFPSSWHPSSNSAPPASIRSLLPILRTHLQHLKMQER